MTAKATPSQATKSDNAGLAAQQGYALPEGFTEVGADRFMFNPNKGCEGFLQGYLLSKLDMPPIQRGKEEPAPWECLLVRTTKPCKGLDRDQKVVEVPAGSDVLTPVTFKIGDSFTNAAADPNYCWEVYIAPLKKTDIGKGGQQMWLYKMGANKSTKKARGDFGVAAILPGAGGVKALPAGAAAAEGAGAGDDAIPF